MENTGEKRRLLLHAYMLQNFLLPGISHPTKILLNSWWSKYILLKCFVYLHIV